MTKKRVYIAGPMTNKDCIEFLANVRRGIRTSVELLLAGYIPFCPFIDYQFFLALRNDEKITDRMIKDYSLEWLAVSDCVLVLPNFKNSKGTLAEIKRAKELGIPIYYSLEDLKKGEKMTHKIYLITKEELVKWYNSHASYASSMTFEDQVNDFLSDKKFIITK